MAGRNHYINFTGRLLGTELAKYFVTANLIILNSAEGVKGVTVASFMNAPSSKELFRKSFCLCYSAEILLTSLDLMRTSSPP